MYKVFHKRYRFEATFEDAYRRETLSLHPMYKVIPNKWKFEDPFKDPYSAINVQSHSQHMEV